MAIPIIGTVLEILNKLLDKIPIQGRKERWKNELENLKKERESLLKGKADEKKSKRITVINTRIDYLNQLLKNSASD